VVANLWFLSTEVVGEAFVLDWLGTEPEKLLLED